MKTVRASYGYDTVILLNASGEMMLSSDGVQITVGSEAKGLAERALEENRIIFSDIYLNNIDGKRYLCILIPLADNRQKGIGTILLRISPDDLINDIVRPWPTQTQTAEVFLVSREADRIVLLDHRGRKPDTAGATGPSAADLNFLRDRILRGYEGPAEGVDYRGEKVFAAIRAVPGWNWYIVTKIDKEEAFGDLDREFVLLVLSAVALAFAAAALFGYIWHRQQARMYIRQYNLEIEKLALAKHYEYLTKYANDIMILFDESGRIIEANERAVATYGYTTEEMSAMNVKGLSAAGEIADIGARLNDLALSDGMVFETVHQRKNGSVFPVEVSARIIEIDTRKFFQYIIRDITRRKLAEDEREKLIQDLEEALSKVEQLSGLLPICSNCKKIKDDRGGWTQIESYIRDHSKAEFTHSICPECAKKLYPDFYGDVWKKKDNG